MKSAYTNGTDAYNSGVQSVSSGEGIQIDNTDPQNPVIATNLTAGNNISLTVDIDGQIEISAAGGSGDTLGQVVHGVIKGPDPVYPTKVSIIGLDQLVEVTGNTQVGYGAKVVKCSGSTGGNIDLENCRVGINTDYAAAQGETFLKGISLVVVNDSASAAFLVMDTSGTIGGAASLNLIPGESVLLWTDSETNWDYRVITRIRLLSAGAGINLGGTASVPEISATGVFEADFGTETLPLAACRNATGIPNINNGGGALLATYKVVPASFMARNLQIFVKQSGAGSCTLALYSEAGALLAYTASFTPSSIGKVTQPLAFDGAGAALTELQLTGGGGYYFVLFGTSAANGAQFYGTDVGLTFGPAPYLGWTLDNITAVPTTISGGSESSQRFYVLATA